MNNNIITNIIKSSEIADNLKLYRDSDLLMEKAMRKIVAQTVGTPTPTPAPTPKTNINKLTINDDILKNILEPLSSGVAAGIISTANGQKIARFINKFIETLRTGEYEPMYLDRMGYGGTAESLKGGGSSTSKQMRDFEYWENPLQIAQSLERFINQNKNITKTEQKILLNLSEKFTNIIGKAFNIDILKKTP
jgi:hypothetical protein